MKTVENDLRAFAQYLENTPSRPDFPAVCRQLHIRPGRLDDWLVRELGTCGERLICEWP